MLAAVLLLVLLYVTPLWSITLFAPQYPEGLGMLIRLDTIEGMKEFDLRNINALNHYIGMRPIDASSIPELRFMPWIVGALIASGVATALFGGIRAVCAWIVSLGVAGVAGLVDFWRWGYEYGHHLDVDVAVIAVPGMTYQPPLIGSKQLLNFTATSLPHLGGLAACFAALLAMTALVVALRKRSGMPRAVVAVFAIATACSSGPQALRVGLDTCAECHMLLSDVRFGAEVVLRSGKVHVFDSIECMHRFTKSLDSGSVQGIWVVDAHAPNRLIAEGQARMLNDGALRPPMGTTYAVAIDAP